MQRPPLRTASPAERVAPYTRNSRRHRILKTDIFSTDLYKYSSDVVPPIYAVSSHVATDKPPPPKDGGKFRCIFSDNLQPIATRAKKARGTLLVDEHCGNGCSIKRAPLSVSYYNEISVGHIWRRLYEEGVLPAQYCPCDFSTIK